MSDTAQHASGPRPVVGIPTCVRPLGASDYYGVADRYVKAVAEGVQAVPLLLPALGDWYEWNDLLGRLDGLLITGARSNIAPHHYGAEDPGSGDERDPARDATNLPLIRAAVAAGLPVLAICRGIQEMNVAFGGTLFHRVHEQPGRDRHHAGDGAPYDQLFAPAHKVFLSDGGQLAAMMGGCELLVNSVHYQGIDRLAPGMAVEAVAPDGQVEAIRVEDAPGFALGVQWHPEWRFWDNPDSARLFAAFGQAVRDRAAGRPA